MKENPGDIIIIDLFTKNYDHMMYGRRDGWMDRQVDRQTDRHRQ